MNRNDKIANKTGLIFKTDWLASNPVFYNLKTGSASHNINEVISSNTKSIFHQEGLHNFINFGYSVFGQTPIKDVCFLPPSSSLHRNQDRSLRIEKLKDPYDKYCDYRLSESDIFELIREKVQKWEKSLPSNQEIVLPLSGGFDSRLLLWCIKDKSRLRSYTYGLSNNQKNSIEVVRAQRLAEKFSIKWKHIQLGDFHNYFSEWNDMFGVSIQAHGMYHIEFYKKIRKDLLGETAFLSGIFGDVWAGSVPFSKLSRAEDLLKIGYTHGIRANPKHLQIKPQLELQNTFWENNKKLLTNYQFQTITTVRLKIILISYLMKTPSFFNFKSWTPYLDIDVAMAMMNLPKKRRYNRLWQKEFFSKVGLDLDKENLKGRYENTLDRQAMINLPLKPLDVQKFSTIFNKQYIEWINQKTHLTELFPLQTRISNTPKVGGFLRLLGIRDKNMEAYYSYMCLKPLEHYL